MAWDTLDMLDIMDTPMPTTDYTMASVLLMLSLRPRLMLILTFSMEVMDILDMLDTMWDTVDTMVDTPMLTMASALLMPSPRLMLTPTFSMEDMDMDTLDMLETMDIPMVDMPTWDKLQSPKQYPATENGQNNHQCLLLQ